MIIIGAKGFAKEVLEIILKNGLNKKEIAFFDNINSNNNLLFGQFKILHTNEEVFDWFQKTDNTFTLGVGNPIIRKKLFDLFDSFGGKSINIISKLSSIGSFETEIDSGTIVCDGVRITNSVKIQKNCLINLNSTIGHDCIIGNFVEICPNVSISGNCIIGNNTFIGTGATINPNIILGKNVIIGAGSVVTKNIPDNSTAVGVPAKIIK